MMCGSSNLVVNSSKPAQKKCNANMKDSMEVKGIERYMRDLLQQAKQLTLSQKSDALDMFVRDGWLAETPGRRGYYSLGVSRSTCPPPSPPFSPSSSQTDR